jgi:DNA-directed RNA polymerase subunit beta
MLLVEKLTKQSKGESMPEPGLPESFNVLMHELKGLGLDIRLEE